jgi:hypothetical protein
MACGKVAPVEYVAQPTKYPEGTHI